MNDHISKCRNGNGNNIFDHHVHECGLKNNCLSPPFFKIYAFMALSTKDKLIAYEKYFHANKFDSMNR